MGALIHIRTGFVLRIETPAKINLGLHVLRRRPDGYHDIETAMVRIGWFDTVNAEVAETITMTSSDPDLPSGQGNLCMRAATTLATHYGVKEGAQLHLTKRIPASAGLGGGSSDAAATLRLLARLWNLDATDADLTRIGARLGADVPFFLGPSPALAEGIGEKLTPLTGKDGAGLSIPYTFVVVKPAHSVSTAEAYRSVTPSESDRVNLPDVVTSRDLARWRAELTNDFEDSVAARFPEIPEIKAALYRSGAGYAAMSGSGSSVFGVFEDRKVAESTAASFEDRDCICWVGEAV